MENLSNVLIRQASHIHIKRNGNFGYLLNLNMNPEPILWLVIAEDDQKNHLKAAFLRDITEKNLSINNITYYEICQQPNSLIIFGPKAAHLLLPPGKGYTLSWNCYLVTNKSIKYYYQYANTPLRQAPSLKHPILFLLLCWVSLTNSILLNTIKKENIQALNELLRKEFQKYILFKRFSQGKNSPKKKEIEYEQVMLGKDQKISSQYLSQCFCHRCGSQLFFSFARCRENSQKQEVIRYCLTCMLYQKNYELVDIVLKKYDTPLLDYITKLKMSQQQISLNERTFPIKAIKNQPMQQNHQEEQQIQDIFDIKEAGEIIEEGEQQAAQIEQEVTKPIEKDDARLIHDFISRFLGDNLVITGKMSDFVDKIKLKKIFQAFLEGYMSKYKCILYMPKLHLTMLVRILSNKVKKTSRQAIFGMKIAQDFNVYNRLSQFNLIEIKELPISRCQTKPKNYMLINDKKQ